MFKKSLFVLGFAVSSAAFASKPLTAHLSCQGTIQDTQISSDFTMNIADYSIAGKYSEDGSSVLLHGVVSNGAFWVKEIIDSEGKSTKSGFLTKIKDICKQDLINFYMASLTSAIANTLKEDAYNADYFYYVAQKRNATNAFDPDAVTFVESRNSGFVAKDPRSGTTYSILSLK